MDRSVLLAHIERTRFPQGDSETARKDAHIIAAFLRDRYGAHEVWGIGSLFEPGRRFLRGSDIDLVVSRIPKDRFFEALGAITKLSSFAVDVIPFEDCNDLVRQTVEESGVRL